VEAQRLLAARREGSYLIRFSGTVPGSYALSTRRRGTVLHTRLYRSSLGRFYLGEARAGEGFASMAAVLAHLNASEKLYQTPVHGSEYERLFADYSRRHGTYVINAGYPSDEPPHADDDD